MNPFRELSLHRDDVFKDRDIPQSKTVFSKVYRDLLPEPEECVMDAGIGPARKLQFNAVSVNQGSSLDMAGFRRIGILWYALHE
jgi:hypothetical protein